MTTEKALREALAQAKIALLEANRNGFTHGFAALQCVNAALSLPETQGKPVNFPDSIYSPFNSCVFKSQCIQREEEQDAPPSQPAQGEEIGEMRITGVHWYGQNPHAFPLGTKFFAAAPAAPTQDGTPLVCLRHGMADITPPCRKWCGGAACTPPTQAKSTNGEG